MAVKRKRFTEKEDSIIVKAIDDGLFSPQQIHQRLIDQGYHRPYHSIPKRMKLLKEKQINSENVENTPFLNEREINGQNFTTFLNPDTKDEWMLFSDLCTVCEINYKTLYVHLKNKPETIIENIHWTTFEKLVKNSQQLLEKTEVQSYSLPIRSDSILIKFMDGINLLFQQLSENSSKNPAVNEIITKMNQKMAGLLDATINRNYEKLDKETGGMVSNNQLIDLHDYDVMRAVIDNLQKTDKNVHKIKVDHLDLKKEVTFNREVNDQQNTKFSQNDMRFDRIEQDLTFVKKTIPRKTNKHPAEKGRLGQALAVAELRKLGISCNEGNGINDLILLNKFSNNPKLSTIEVKTSFPSDDKGKRDFYFWQWRIRKHQVENSLFHLFIGLDKNNNIQLIKFIESDKLKSFLTSQTSKTFIFRLTEKGQKEEIEYWEPDLFRFNKNEIWIKGLLNLKDMKSAEFSIFIREKRKQNLKDFF